MAAISGVWSINRGFLVHMIKKFLHLLTIFISLHTPSFAMDKELDEYAGLNNPRGSLQLNDPTDEPKVSGSRCLSVALLATLGLFISGVPIAYVTDWDCPAWAKIALIVFIAAVGTVGGGGIGYAAQKCCDK